MDSKLAIATIKESCYQVGYPTHDAEYERRKLINESCDYAINCIEKLEKIKQIVDDCDSGMISSEQLFINLRTILEQE